MIIMPAMRGLFRKPAELPPPSSPPTYWLKFNSATIHEDSGTRGSYPVLGWASQNMITSNDVPPGYTGSSADFTLNGEYGQEKIYHSNNTLGFNLSDKKFTIEFMIKIENEFNGTRNILLLWDNTGLTNSSNLLIYVFYADGYIYISNGYNTPWYNMYPIKLGIWNHLAIVKSDESQYSIPAVYFNSINLGSGMIALGTANVGTIILGSASVIATSDGLDGKIDDFRIYLGYAKYTSNFTVPTSESA